MRTADDITVRQARDGDLPVVRRMAEQLARHDGSPSVAPDGCCLVAEFGDVTVGMVCLRRPDGGAVALSHLFVSEAHRRRGIGTALLEAAIAHAAERGASAVELLVGRDNRAALDFSQPCMSVAAPAMGDLAVGSSLGV